MREKAGYVYILSNPSMPGLLKIGRSIHGGKKRAKQIYSQGGTGVPTEFYMEFEIYANDCEESEILIHEELQEYRINSGREFFKIDIEAAVKTVVNIVCSEYQIRAGYADFTLTDDDIIPSYGVKSAKIIKELFGNIPEGIVLARALCDYLSDKSVIDAIVRMKAAHDKKRIRIEEMKNGK